MTRELTVAASAVCAFIEFARSRGAARPMLVQRAGIDPRVLCDRDGRVPFGQYVALVRAGQDLCEDPALALHFGEAVECSEISVPAGAATNIEEAVAQGNRYGRLAVDVESVGTTDRFGLIRQSGQLWMVDRRSNPNDFPELTESAFARMVCSTRRLMGGATPIKSVHVTHEAPAYRAEYDRIFQVPLTFGSARNAMQLDEAVMSRVRLPSQSTYVAGVLQDHAEGLLRKLDGAQSTRGRVENLIRPILHTRNVTVESIAAQLGLSRQTLFRKLNAEGVTFQQVLDELRHRTALHYLISDKASLQQTAHLVGFSDPTAFSRAFKRWTGLRPREYVARSESPV